MGEDMSEADFFDTGYGCPGNIEQAIRHEILTAPPRGSFNAHSGLSIAPRGSREGVGRGRELLTLASNSNALLEQGGIVKTGTDPNRSVISPVVVLLPPT